MKGLDLELVVSCLKKMLDHFLELKQSDQKEPDKKKEPEDEDDLWDELVSAALSHKFKYPEIAPGFMAQWILESGRGTSDLSRICKNFAGLKWRDEMKPFAEPHTLITPTEPQGAVWCSFETVEDFIKGFEFFVTQRSPYKGIEDHVSSPEAYLKFMKSRGYAEDDKYVSKTLRAVPEATKLLKIKITDDSSGAWLRAVRKKKGWIYGITLEVRENRTNELITEFFVGSGTHGNLEYLRNIDSVQGSMNPIAEGYYTLERFFDDGISLSFNGDAKRVLPVIIIDRDYDTKPGCVNGLSMKTPDEMKMLKKIVEEKNIKHLTVNWGLGSVETGVDLPIHIEPDDRDPKPIGSYQKEGDGSRKPYPPFGDKTSIKAHRQIWSGVRMKGAIIHFTAGWARSERDAINMGNSTRYTFWVIGPRGEIYCTHPLDKAGYHSGTHHHRNHLGIEICAGGILKKKGANWYTWFGYKVPRNKLRSSKRNANIKPGTYEKFTEEQEKSLTRLLLWLKANDPDYFSFDSVLGHDEVSPSQKSDPGAALSMTMPEYRNYLKRTYKSQ